MSEYQVKMEAIREYQDALRLKKVYEEAIEVNSGLLRAVVAHYESRGLEIPADVHRFMKNLVEVVESVSPAVERSQASPEDENGTLPCAPKE